ncbi:hypothetical protein BD289DRAFT_201847 [Coniella lustricola]|uniref:Uncharacterized protein n=1 Tax=Coniella lustricola TaxID=2025994 RepID=A0A2T3ACH7_9PEZI|nr:hypothetical protein BD289DRAFT_201847 [Coniella lustricola]
MRCQFRLDVLHHRRQADRQTDRQGKSVITKLSLSILNAKAPCIESHEARRKVDRLQKRHVAFWNSLEAIPPPLFSGHTAAAWGAQAINSNIANTSACQNPCVRSVSAAAGVGVPANQRQSSFPGSLGTPSSFISWKATLTEWQKRDVECNAKVGSWHYPTWPSEKGLLCLVAS